MSWTNLTLGGNWGGEMPEYVEVCHEGGGDSNRYVPERTCRVGYEYEGVPFFHPIHVHELTCGHDVRLFEDVPRYCPYCGAKVVSE